MAEHQNLVEDVKRAISLIKGLTASREQRHADMPLGTEAMPKNELLHCAGVAFTFTRKVGILLSYEQGHGFVIAKLPSDTAVPNWSAPLYFKSYGSSVGLTAGMSMVDSVIILDTQEAVDAFKQKSQATLNADLNISLAGKVGVNMPATALDMVHPRLTNKTFAYSATKGLMVVDSSLKGLGYRVNDKLIAELYNGANAQDVLAGNVPSPPDFSPLYQAIGEVIMSPTREVGAGVAELR